jgi:quercetin dioxygenase-like cupin family protein
MDGAADQSWGDDESLDATLLHERAVGRFSRRVVELAPGGALDLRDRTWQEAIVFVTAGELDVESSGGERHRFRTGDVLTLARLPIRGAYNRGATPTRLLAVWRTP